MSLGIGISSSIAFDHATDTRAASIPTVYSALAEHQMSDRWELRDLLRELHRWVGIFVFEFKLEISDVALRVDGLRLRRLGHFHPGHNGFGLEREIAINRRHVHKREFWEILGTLLHELVHAWQEVHGRPAKGPYHNVEFRLKAREFGLVVDERGFQQYEPGGRFIQLLEQHGVSVPDVPAPAPQTVGSPKLKLWVCACDPPFRVRVARASFRATCGYCGRQFFQLEPKWGANRAWGHSSMHHRRVKF